MTKRSALHHIVLILLLLLPGCTRWQPDTRLAAIAESASTAPGEALDSLAAIDYNALSEANRHYHDFLTVKATDKAYITHTSDSLILKVIDYESSHKNRGLYPEALYYGGRVYSDLGDYPTALQYFHNSLDLLPADTENQALRSSVLSQTGRLLNALRLYKEAVPYIEATLDIDRQLNDSINEMHDLLLLGNTHLRADDYKSAEKCFSAALIKSQTLPASHRARSAMHLAAAKHELGQIDSALMLIRGTPGSVSPITRNTALAYASEIYMTAGIPDTAYMYAHSLINSKSEKNKKTGYAIILQPELRHKIHPDTLDAYYTDYLRLLESYYNLNETQLAINQQSLYNYQIHQRESEKAKAANENLKRWIYILAVALLTMVIVILYLKNRTKKNIIDLHTALENINRLEASLNQQQNKDNKKLGGESEESAMSVPVKKETARALREKLRNRLLEVYKSRPPMTIAPEVLQSETYIKLQDIIASNSHLKDNCELWQEMEEVVLRTSPHFKEHLQLLTGGKMTQNDLHTALLIKFGVQPTQMTILLNRSKGAIVSRRESLCFRIFDEKLGTKTIDGIIRLL